MCSPINNSICAKFKLLFEYSAMPNITTTKNGAQYSSTCLIFGQQNKQRKGKTDIFIETKICCSLSLSGCHRGQIAAVQNSKCLFLFVCPELQMPPKRCINSFLFSFFFFVVVVARGKNEAIKIAVER